MYLQMVRDLEAPGEGTHVSMWQDMANLLMKVVVMAAGVRPFCRVLHVIVVDAQGTESSRSS